MTLPGHVERGWGTHGTEVLALRWYLMILGCVGVQLSGFPSLVCSSSEAEIQAAAWLRLGLALLPMGRVGFGVHETSWSISSAPEEVCHVSEPTSHSRDTSCTEVGELRECRAPSALCLQTSVPSLPRL